MKPGPSGYCFAHDEDRAAERDAARRLGGLRRSGQLARAVLSEAEAGPLELSAPGEVRRLLAETIQAARTGKLDHQIAGTVGSLSNVLLRALEQDTMAARLDALEAALAQRGPA